MLIEFIILVIAIILHELGHYIGYLSFGYKPNIRFNMGIIEVGGNINHNVKIKHNFLIALLGIITGWIYLALMSQSTELILFYLLISSIDISHIAICLTEKDWNLTNLELLKRYIKRAERC